MMDAERRAKMHVHQLDARDKELHEAQLKWKCFGCFFCDEKAHAKGKPCCTKCTPAVFSNDGEKCLSRDSRKRK